MGLRYRRSKKILPGVRLNLNKDSFGVTLGGRGLRYTINSKGRKTATVGIPGTGLSYSKTSSKQKTVLPQAVEQTAAQTFTPICEISKRSSIGPSIISAILGVWGFFVALSEPNFINILLFAFLASAVYFLLLVRDNIKTAKRVVEIHPEVADGPLESPAAENAVLTVYGGTKWRMVFFALCAIGFLAFVCAAAETEIAGYISFGVVLLVYAWLSLYGRLKIAKAKRLVLKHLDESEQ